MELRHRTRKAIVAAGLIGLLLAASACAARVAVLGIDRLETPVARVEGVELALDWPDGAVRGQLRLRAARLDAGELGYRWRALEGQCRLDRANDGAWRCLGRMQARGAAGLEISLRLHEDALRVELGDAHGRLAVAGSVQQDSLGLELIRVPAVWLQPMLTAAWSQARLTEGRIDAQWRIEPEGDAIALGGPLQIKELGLDTADGRIAAAGVAASGELRLRLDDALTRIESQLEFRCGEVLAGALYAALPEHAVRMALRLTGDAAGLWQVESLRWTDPGALDLGAGATIDPAGETLLRAADVRVDLPDLAVAMPRYFEALAASFGLGGLRASGSARARVQLREGRWQALDLGLAKLDIEDGQGRFGAHGLEGDLRLRQGAEAADSTLSWGDAHLHSLALGASRLAWRSAGGGLALSAPADVPLLGGRLHLARLNYSPSATDERFELSLALEDVDLAALSSAFGWPAFGGKISGELPAVRYEGGRLAFDGGLRAGVFDGLVEVSELSMERPFGVAPMLSASIDFSGLDLAPLTGAFGFGEITGRLDGHIRGLRLLDWEPVAFDAALRTVPRSGERQRISQRAVRELTEVGGGGLAAGLQNQMLKAFSSFGYSRIGLSCVLANNVCTMGGAGPADGGGYVIVDGAGLPRVNVIGHQKRVDWPVLVARLKAATEGQVPVID